MRYNCTRRNLGNSDSEYAGEIDLAEIRRKSIVSYGSNGVVGHRLHCIDVLISAVTFALMQFEFEIYVDDVPRRYALDFAINFNSEIGKSSNGKCNKYSTAVYANLFEYIIYLCVILLGFMLSNA